MTPPVIATLLAALTAALSLIWTVIYQLLILKGRRQPDRTVEAGRNLELMRSLGTGGMDPHLDQREAQRIHEAEIHKLEQTVRISAARFAVQALPVEPARGPWLLMGFVSAILFGTGVAILITSRARPDPADHLYDVISGLILYVVGITGCLLVFTRLSTRHLDRMVLDQAGIEARRRQVSVRDSLTSWRTHRAARRLRLARMATRKTSPEAKQRIGTFHRDEDA
ncbi:hypothetical protein [Clavibacter sp. CT19]|uniref:hypothetical protein n=1 Tax=unclassified Clavibacter TaxID=2626594 RepID=UPI0022EB681A|nr:hypothetical protein [Clavibacter sp. CT19]MDA3805389.1 hypothetical protein [Clavibacter sp. CT19]